jgi:nucleoside-diphosphate-sugar epimerase
MSKEKKILILGAAGFIGVNLCRFYLKKNYKVTGVDNFHLGTKKNIDSLKKEFGNQFSFKEIDILVFKNLKKIPKKKFLKIINLVANSDISKSNSNSLLDVNLNFITMVNVLDYFKNFKKTKFFFLVLRLFMVKTQLMLMKKLKI